MKKGFVYICFLCCISWVHASHRDHLDVISYTLNLDMTHIDNRFIKGYAELNIRPIKNIDKITLDLYKLPVDSVFINGRFMDFFQNDSLLSVDTFLLKDSIVNFKAYYQGYPKQDLDWGGFNFSNDYAFNIGVGMDSYPHAVGRYWYPCIDNFTDRASYEFVIKTKAEHMAVCGGNLLQVSQDTNNAKYYHWKINNPIPTYLSSVGIGPFVEVRDTFEGVWNNIPITIYAAENYRHGVRQTFNELHSTLKAFEKTFGPYPWSTVGFVVVPFRSGAMEHAMNIAYPNYALTGSVKNKNLVAHELAHSWFGNWVTCKTSSEMWLNEGWASYAEVIFKAEVYGEKVALDHMKANHKYVLQTAPYIDGGYYALNGIPKHLTYGKTVYDKGADVVHNLRGYLGDSLFFSAVKNYLNNYALSHATSQDLMVSFGQSTGVPLHDFFKNWVYQAGFPHYSIDSFFTDDEGTVHLSLQQRLKYREAFSNKNRIPISLIDFDWNRLDTVVEFDGRGATITFKSAVHPDVVFTDLNHRLNDATTHDNQSIFEKGVYSFTHCNLKMSVDQCNDTSLVNVVYNWVAPEPAKKSIPGIALSNHNYWKIEGLIPTVLKGVLIFDYNFGQNTNPEVSYNIKKLDRVVLLYRENSGRNWKVITIGAAARHGSGNIQCSEIKPGEYAIGFWDGETILPPIP